MRMMQGHMPHKQDTKTLGKCNSISRLLNQEWLQARLFNVASCVFVFVPVYILVLVLCFLCIQYTNDLLLSSFSLYLMFFFLVVL